MEPRFLTVQDVLFLHTLGLQAFGGRQGVRDTNALESAVAAPTHTFGGEFLHSTVPAMAAAYWYSLSENHPFVDGNKRTALLACETFLNLNGLELAFDDEERVYDIAITIAKGEFTKTDLIRMVEGNCIDLRLGG